MFIVNGISRTHQRDVVAGDLGVLVRDGQQPYPDSEYLGEAYHTLVAVKGVAFRSLTSSSTSPATTATSAKPTACSPRS